MTTRSVLLVTFLVLAPVSGTALAQSPPPDQVTLTNGGMVRGTIIENMPGDHVTIQLPTGETRRFAASEVQTAGPAPTQPPPQGPVMGTPTQQPQQPPLPPAPYVPPPQQLQPTVTLHVTANRPRVSLHRMTGSSVVAVWTGRGVGTGIVESFELMCNTPCDLAVPPGAYTLGLAEGEGQARRADHSIYNFTRDTQLYAEYESREGFRIAGWVLFTAATIGYLIGALAPIGDTNYLDIFLGVTIGYAVVSIVSLVFIMLRDHADIHEGAPPNTMRM